LTGWSRLFVAGPRAAAKEDLISMFWTNKTLETAEKLVKTIK
jgi:hypothetical protein